MMMLIIMIMIMIMLNANHIHATIRNSNHHAIQMIRLRLAAPGRLRLTSRLHPGCLYARLSSKLV